jgi:hypothetical protein
VPFSASPGQGATAHRVFTIVRLGEIFSFCSLEHFIFFVIMKIKDAIRAFWAVLRNCQAANGPE